MSITSIHQCKDLRAIVHYCITPKKGQETERVACMYSDLGDSELFLKYGEETIRSHNRKVQGYTLLQSFPKHELDVTNQEHIAFANDLGRKLVYALYPNSPCIVITHTDGDGQCLHNHIIVLNHDLKTDKCIRENRHYKYVKKANDALMREHGLEVCEPSKCKLSQGEYWSNRRNNWLDQLRASVDKALANATSIQEFSGYLLAEGVTLSLYKKNGVLKEHFTFTVTDSAGKIHKKRSDRLGKGYSRKEIENTLLLQRKKKQQQSIMSMSDWIEIQKAKEREVKTDKTKESSHTPTDIINTIETVKKKTEESPAIPEREKEMKKQISASTLRELKYQEWKKGLRNIQLRIKMLEEAKEKANDNYTSDEEDRVLNELEEQRWELEYKINEFERKLEPQNSVSLDESLLSGYDSSKEKDDEFSM